MKLLFTLLCVCGVISVPFASAQEVKAVEKPAEQLKAEALYKEGKFKEVIAILEKLIPATKATTPAEVANKHTMMRSHAFAYFRMQKKDEYKKLMEQRYEYITAQSMRFPDDAKLVILRLYDMSALAGQFNIRKESERRIALNLQAVTIADDLVKKAPNNEDAKICQFTAYVNLAKSYRWNNELRAKVPATVDKGLAVLDTIKKFPKHTSKAYMTLQIQSLKVSVLTLNKEYKKAFDVSSDLLEKTKPMLENKTSQYHLSELFGALYHHAFLYEKLGDSKKAQKKLQDLLDIIDACLEKAPENRLFLNAKTRYSKWKGKELR